MRSASSRPMKSGSAATTMNAHPHPPPLIGPVRNCSKSLSRQPRARDCTPPNAAPFAAGPKKSNDHGRCSTMATAIAPAARSRAGGSDVAQLRDDQAAEQQTDRDDHHHDQHDGLEGAHDRQCDPEARESLDTVDARAAPGRSNLDASTRRARTSINHGATAHSSSPPHRPRAMAS